MEELMVKLIAEIQRLTGMILVMGLVTPIIHAWLMRSK